MEEPIVTLVKKAQQGDKDALVYLVMQRKEQLYQIAYSYMKDKQKVMDVMQDTILKVFVEIKSLKKHEAFYTWYIRVLLNTCKEHIRRERKVLPLEIDEQSNSMQKPYWIEEWIDIENKLSKLKEEFRKVIVLRYIEDLSIKDIADILECSEGTVKSRLYYGLKELKRQIDWKGGCKYGMQ